ncbi:MAG: hypothetical protein ACTJGD_01075 [Mesonia hippocampi]|uniref:hypothetical protein n=1 Tax=Mesonia hippocampi TaxID=1628250 RepID=UPI003F9C4ADC
MLIEKQRFRQIWLWIILIGINAMMLYGFVQQIIFKIPFGDNPGPDILLIFLCLMMLGLSYLFLNVIVLKTYIDNEKIVVKFPPLVAEEVILIKDIAEAKIVKYKPLKEYGGWGFRSGKKGMAYNISGNLGLSITYKSGKHLLIGIQKPEKYSKFPFIANTLL